MIFAPRPPVFVRRVGVVVAVLVTAAAACGESTDNDTRSATQGLPDVQESLQAHDWVLDAADSTPSLGSDATVTLTFGDDALSGQAPCNTYRASYTVDGDAIEVGEIASTKRACEDPLMEAEQRYLAALAQVTTVDDTDRDALVLASDGDVRLRFDVQDPAAAIQGAWTVVNLNTGDALTGPIDGTEPTLTFSADGSLSADTGCNVLQTGWAVDGTSITIDPPRQTMKACEDPAGIMDQEAALGAALAASARVEVSDQLTLFDDQGRMVVIADRTPT